MGSGFIEPDEVIEQFVVEGFKVFKEQVFVELDEFFLESAVEALSMRIHFGALGIGQPAHCAIIEDDLGELGFEL